MTGQSLEQEQAEKDRHLKKLAFRAGMEAARTGGAIGPLMRRMIEKKGWDEVYNSGLRHGKAAADLGKGVFRVVHQAQGAVAM